MIDSLIRLAAEQQRQFDATTSPRMRKERGQFGTAPAIADFMAGMFTQIPQGPVRILDPGAGVGILSAAVCQRILQQRSRHHLIFELWENDLHLEVRLPFKISTGPVVAFRSREFLRRERSNDTAPLLWMHNVRPFVTQFPSKNGKPMHILVSGESVRLLLPAKRYVLLKRFTAKEERKRLVAGIVEAGDLYSPVVGLENHLNYIYSSSGELSEEEAFGLAALFNSVLVDRYFRAISGNTQVNAAEIRAMPLPCVETIREIGRAVARNNDTKSTTVERVVGEAIGLPKKLIVKLCETSQ
jgi:hypothetical protein